MKRRFCLPWLLLGALAFTALCACRGDDDTTAAKERETLEQQVHDIHWMALSPDDRYLGTMHGTSGELLLWDLKQKKLIDLLYAGATAAFAPDNKTLTTLSIEEPVKLWEIPTLKAKGTLGDKQSERRDRTPSKIVYSVDGKRVVCGGRLDLRDSNDWRYWVKIWDAESGKELASFDYQEKNWDIVLAKDGKTVISIGEDSAILGEGVIIRFWSVETGKEVDSWKTGKCGVRALAISKDAKRLVTKGEEKILLWDLSTGKQVADLSNKRRWSDDSRSLGLSSDGKTLAVPDGDRMAVIDTESGKIKKWLRGHEKGTSAVTITNDGKTIISAGADGRIKFWDMPD